MTSVNITAVTNTVTVVDGDTTVVTVTTAGPQGPIGPSAPVNPVLISLRVIAEDYTVTSGYNALSVEDVSVAATYTVTVPSGATWVVV